MTEYPFQLPEMLMRSLPDTSCDGNYYVDVRVKDKWDGILVIDRDGRCIGVYVGSKIVGFQLPFEVHEIQDLRKASLFNRILGWCPIDLYAIAVLMIVFVSPISMGFGLATYSAFFIFSIFVCLASIHILYLCRGFPLTRLPVASLGCFQIMLSAIMLLMILTTIR